MCHVGVRRAAMLTLLKGDLSVQVSTNPRATSASPDPAGPRLRLWRTALARALQVRTALRSPAAQRKRITTQTTKTWPLQSVGFACAALTALQALPTTAAQDRELLRCASGQARTAAAGVQSRGYSEPGAQAWEAHAADSALTRAGSARLSLSLGREPGSEDEQGIGCSRLATAVQARLEAKLVLSAALHVLRRCGD